jgi:hypothetical protein
MTQRDDPLASLGPEPHARLMRKHDIKQRIFLIP